MRLSVFRFLGCVWLFVVLAAAASSAEPSAPGWLERLNYYRATAQLPPVTEDAALSGAVREHARYMLAHGAVQHSEDRRDRQSTVEGAAAAASSNLAASNRPGEPETWAVDLWMQAPFHAIGMLDPALQEVGFGIQHAAGGRLQSAAGLDVIRGRSVMPAPAAYPIVWPANGASVPLSAHTAEYPNPLTSCPGYALPAGLPLIVQLGAGGEAPRVTGSWIAEDDQRLRTSDQRLLEHCVFDEGTYQNRDAVQQQLARRILASRNAIVLIPRAPLRRGSRYRAVIEVNGRLIDWTFGIAPTS